MKGVTAEDIIVEWSRSFSHTKQDGDTRNEPVYMVFLNGLTLRGPSDRILMAIIRLSNAYSATINVAAVAVRRGAHFYLPLRRISRRT